MEIYIRRNRSNCFESLWSRLLFCFFCKCLCFNRLIQALVSHILLWLRATLLPRVLPTHFLKHALLLFCLQAPWKLTWVNCPWLVWDARRLWQNKPKPRAKQKTCRIPHHNNISLFDAQFLVGTRAPNTTQLLDQIISLICDPLLSFRFLSYLSICYSYASVVFSCAMCFLPFPEMSLVHTCSQFALRLPGFCQHI